ncbi:ribonuclease P family protein / Rpp14 family protein, partial [Thalictrum thalictroides]
LIYFYFLLQTDLQLWIIMVRFRNRYLVMEIFLDPNKDLAKDDPIILTANNVSKAIKDSIRQNFGECGLASLIGSFQVTYVNNITKLCIIRVAREGLEKLWSSTTMVRSIGQCQVMFNLLDLSGSIRACKVAALKCDEAKSEQYKQLMGDNITPEITETMQNCLEKIKILS